MFLERLFVANENESFRKMDNIFEKGRNIAYAKRETFLIAAIVPKEKIISNNQSIGEVFFRYFSINKKSATIINSSNNIKCQL